MTKPTPIAELVVRRNSDRSFDIFTASSEAAEWVKQEMPAYGGCHTVHPNQFYIPVAPTFDVEDVIRYAESYNQIAPTPD